MNSKADIKREILKELQSDPLLAPIVPALEIDVEGGVAVLSGTVDSFLLKNTLEEAVLRVEEVEAVSLNIHVLENA